MEKENFAKTLREIMRDQQDPEVAPPAKMSLMALMADEDGRSEEQEDCVEEEVEEEERIVSVCCVCLVRNRGAAFIPCGHTFCRLCSRELWDSRGSCPLCNRFIHEILDIF